MREGEEGGGYSRQYKHRRMRQRVKFYVFFVDVIIRRGDIIRHDNILHAGCARIYN